MALRLEEVRQLLVRLAAKAARRSPERQVVQARRRLTLEQRRRLLAQEARWRRRDPTRPVHPLVQVPRVRPVPPVQAPALVPELVMEWRWQPTVRQRSTT